ncbi:V-type proton ATPase subunit E [Hibiscus syriacus]|uniref:V-type proton ATPase subunit E n=1 Tax=Hibiscus syriacus TaxID=106335 RepID=A0A6A3BEE7_HIBSY|nr:V-type proton ATPase subunit E [Hibiscus syriacus]
MSARESRWKYKNLIKVLQAQDELVNLIKETAMKELQRLGNDKRGYKNLVKALVVQSLVRLREPSVFLRCREVDRKLVEFIIEEAKREYAEKFIVAPLRLSSTISGQIVLASEDGKIVFVSTLDASLEVAFKQELPEMDTVMKKGYPWSCFPEAVDGYATNMAWKKHRPRGEYSRMGWYPSECMERLVGLALSCCEDNPEKRPSMLEVVRQLEYILKMLPQTESVSSSSDSMPLYSCKSLMESSSYGSTNREFAIWVKSCFLRPKETKLKAEVIKERSGCIKSLWTWSEHGPSRLPSWASPWCSSGQLHLWSYWQPVWLSLVAALIGFIAPVSAIGAILTGIDYSDLDHVMVLTRGGLVPCFVRIIQRASRLDM